MKSGGCTCLGIRLGIHLGIHLGLKEDRDPTKTLSSTQVVKLTALCSHLDPHPYSVLSCSIAFTEVKYQESGGGS